MSNKFSEALKANLEQTNERIDRALDEALRNHAGLTMIAVTKRQPLAVVRAAYDLGIRHFGENQIQEGVPKVRALPDDITWHLIGTLQKNKVRKAVKYFQILHSIDSLSLLTKVDAVAQEERLNPHAFLQVNLARDPAKHGLHPEEVEPVLESALDLKSVRCIGLMGIAPVSDDGDQIKAFFEGMRDMRDRLRETYPEWPGKLSLGMSGDFEAAIAAGASYIRLGTTLFGERTSG
jgi:PLP dependent protein